MNIDTFNYNQPQFNPNFQNSTQKMSKKTSFSSLSTSSQGITALPCNNEELIHRAREMASDQNGCRFIQKKIENEPEIGNDVFDSLEKDLLTLSCGSFGNYLLQKLLCVIDSERVGRFVDIVIPFFVKVAVSSHGTRVIQKLLDIIRNNNEMILKITNVLNTNLLEITMDANSNHIIQKYVSVIPFPMNATVYENIIKGRELGAYNARFESLEKSDSGQTQRFNIFDLDSVRAMFNFNDTEVNFENACDLLEEEKFI